MHQVSSLDIFNYIFTSLSIGLIIGICFMMKCIVKKNDEDKAQLLKLKKELEDKKEELRKINEENYKSILTKANIIKGRNFEEQIVKLLEDKHNYQVIKNYENGVKDEGIDIIAKSKNEILLIQCKNWNCDFIKEIELHKFLLNAQKFKEKYFKDDKREIKNLFITSKENHRKFLEYYKFNNKNFDFRIIRYERA